LQMPARAGQAWDGFCSFQQQGWLPVEGCLQD
jgi:hypothetical protein